MVCTLGSWKLPVYGLLTPCTRRIHIKLFWLFNQHVISSEPSKNALSMLCMISDLISYVHAPSEFTPLAADLDWLCVNLKYILRSEFTQRGDQKDIECLGMSEWERHTPKWSQNDQLYMVTTRYILMKWKGKRLVLQSWFPWTFLQEYSQGILDSQDETSQRATANYIYFSMVTCIHLIDNTCIHVCAMIDIPIDGSSWKYNYFKFT